MTHGSYLKGNAGLKETIDFMRTQNFFNSFSKKSHLFYEGPNLTETASGNGTLKELRKIREILVDSNDDYGQSGQEES